MTLTSLTFLGGFLLSLVIYYILPKKAQWVALLLFSLGFFVLSATPYTLVYLIITMGSTTFFARRIAWGKAWENDEEAKKALVRGIAINLGILALLKYDKFIVTNMNALLAFLQSPNRLEVLNLRAPMGVSFYTFTAAGYLLDTYWGITEPQSSLLKTALFIGYYPQLTSGPISRYGEMEKTLYSGHRFDYRAVTFGLERMLWGIFKKLVLSARLGIVVDTIYGDIEAYPGLYIWLAAGLFMLQLYTDFSGCMDIILGASECYGVTLPENFRTPFFSRSVQEFWQRWHITLGGWMRDYILYPVLRSKRWRELTKWTKAHLGKKAARQLPSYLGMLCVWLLMGLWHGGDWKYIVGQGLWFWAMIVLSQVCEPAFKKATDALHIKTESFSWHLFQSLRVFALVSFGNMFFRLESLEVAFATMRAGLKWNPQIFVDGSLFQLGLDRPDLWVTVLGLVVLLAVSALEETGKSVRQRLAEQNLVFRWVLLFALIFATLILGLYGPGYDAQAFIYQAF